MSKNISRRAFLKCTGAVALAVGASGMLSGCDLFDGIANAIADKAPDGVYVGKAVVRVDNVLSHEIAAQQEAQTKLFDALNINVNVGNVLDSVDISAKLKVGDVEATRVKRAEASAYINAQVPADKVIDGNVTLSESGKEINGWMIFKLPEEVIADWTKAELIFTGKGESKSFIITRDVEAGSISYAKK